MVHKHMFETHGDTRMQLQYYVSTHVRLYAGTLQKAEKGLTGREGLFLLDIIRINGGDVHSSSKGGDRYP